MKLKDLLRESDEYAIYHSISRATTMADAVKAAEKIKKLDLQKVSMESIMPAKLDF